MTQKIDPQAAKTVVGSGYPKPFDTPCSTRRRRRLGDAAGLTQFGVNHMSLPPGAWSSQRHWHSAEDEFVYVLEGELVLVTDSGEEILRPGDCAGFKAGEADGHHLQNRSQQTAVYLEIGARQPHSDSVTYPDIDLLSPAGRDGYTHTDGTPYS